MLTFLLMLATFRSKSAREGSKGGKKLLISRNKRRVEKSRCGSNYKGFKSYIIIFLDRGCSRFGELAEGPRQNGCVGPRGGQPGQGSIT